MVTYIGEASCGTNIDGTSTWAFLGRGADGRVGVYQVPADGIADTRALLRALRDDPSVARPVVGSPDVPVLREPGR